MSEENENSKSKINLKEILDKMPTYVSIFDGSQPEYDGGPQPEKQSIYFGCNYENKPTVIIEWIKKGRGFGQYCFQIIDGKMVCHSEGDSKETVKEILCDMVDQCIFDV